MKKTTRVIQVIRNLLHAYFNITLGCAIFAERFARETGNRGAQENDT